MLVPNHVGLILDGNRRWAKARGLPTLEGHRKGSDTLREVALAAYDRGVKYVSAFVFSTENWSRTDKEVNYLMGLVVKLLTQYLDEFNERGIKVVILGRREGLRSNVLKAIQKAEEMTKHNTGGTLAFCFNYGGQEEIVDATKQLISQGTSAEAITKESLSGAMYGPDVPPIDLLVRTSGEQRLSGFMLWRAAYAELYFTDTMWPDFTPSDLDGALAEYQSRHRRFGT